MPPKRPKNYQLDLAPPKKRNAVKVVGPPKFTATHSKDDQTPDQCNSNKTHQAKMWKVVLTGGPCGGKSTALATIRKEMASQGIVVYSVPEVATVFMSAGLSFTDVGKANATTAVQFAMMRTQLRLEDEFEAVARAVNISQGQDTLIVCDRGVCDAKAYCTVEQWNEMMSSASVTEEQLLGRYDGVLHLVTAAHGAESHYTLENNITRTETPQQARELDDRVKTSYSKHKQLKIIDNAAEGGITGKLKRIVSCLKEIIRGE